ncbi:MAG: YncE family protein [Rubrobacter sp.]|nr:YncE family protein [Rubrobacter sp.]
MLKEKPRVLEEATRKMKRKAYARRRRRRLAVVSVAVLVMAMFAAYYFIEYSSSGSGSLIEFSETYSPFKSEPSAAPGQLPTKDDQEAGNDQSEAQEEQGTTASEEPSDNVYAATMSGQVKESLANLPERVYVPDVTRNEVEVIDPKTFQIIDSFAVEQLPYHVTPSWDMSTLYVNNEASNSFTVIDPQTGRPSDRKSVTFPYNFYFSPDGSKAIVVAERLQRIGFRDPKTWDLLGSVYIPWPGVDHLDFSKDGSYFLASSEWSGVVSKIDTNKMELVDYADVGGLPIDIKLSPDGSVFYVANQGTMGVSLIDGDTMKQVDFIPTGEGAHGLQVSRDTKYLYVSNRLEGTISVIDFAKRKVVDTWYAGGTPDMLQISPDGRQLWVSGRYDGAVYVLDTTNGKSLATIYTGTEPHGLAYFPNPGRFSLGHNGVYR